MKAHLIVIAGLAAVYLSLQSIRADDSTTLRAHLKGPWTSLTAALMLNQGCTAPCYYGMKLERRDGKILIRRWEQDMQQKETYGAAREIRDAELHIILESLQLHHARALHSMDISEQITALPKADRERAWTEHYAELRKQGRRPIGGVRGIGIDIRISGDVRTVRYENNYGASREEEFSNWLMRTIHGK